MEVRAKNYDQKSEFLWPDFPGAKPSDAGTGSLINSEQLSGWIKDGYSVINNATASTDIDLFLKEVQTGISDASGEFPISYWDNSGHHYAIATPELLNKREAKILDLHTRLPSAYPLIFAKPTLDFLKCIFKDEVVAFQTLYFEYGSQQGAHQDTAFVYTDPAYHFAASWIALEDIKSGTGELFYYPGSQSLPDLIFSNGSKALLPGDPDTKSYSAELEKLSEDHGLHRKTFIPKKSDTLLWSADLIHGGEEAILPRTRRSFVTHYCPLGATVPYMRKISKKMKSVGDGAWVVGQY